MESNGREGMCDYLSVEVIVSNDVSNNDIHMRRPFGLMFLDLSPRSLLFDPNNWRLDKIGLIFAERHRFGSGPQLKRFVWVHTEYLQPSGDSLQFSGLCEHFSKWDFKSFCMSVCLWQYMQLTGRLGQQLSWSSFVSSGISSSQCWQATTRRGQRLAMCWGSDLIVIPCPHFKGQCTKPYKQVFRCAYRDRDRHTDQLDVSLDNIGKDWMLAVQLNHTRVPRGPPGTPSRTFFPSTLSAGRQR